MITYIQVNNRNSFTLRFKKYKVLRRDIWGRLALRNRKNNITSLMAVYARRDFFRRIRFFTRERKRKIFKKLKLRRKRYFFFYDLSSKPRKRLPKNHKFRVGFKFLRKSLFFYYGLRKTTSVLRKLFSPRRKPINQFVTPFFLERRADVLFFRAKLVESIKIARYYIKCKQLYYIIPQHKRKTFYAHSLVKRPNTEIPLFAFLKLSPVLTIRRKITLFHELRSRRKLMCLTPQHLYTNYNLMISLLINNPERVRYPFVNSKNLRFFMGAARFF